MKKFKLIKEYPTSPKLGHILKPVKGSESYYVKGNFLNPLDYPEYWEEVAEKTYEILSFIVDSNKCILTKRENGLFVYDRIGAKNGVYSEEDILSGDPKRVDWVDSPSKYGYSIHSVKRLSDGEVFTVGDSILEQKEHSKIKYFELRGEDLVLRIDHQLTKGSSTILISSNFQKIKQSLLTTKDGVDIFENETAHLVNKKTASIYAKNVKITGKLLENNKNKFLYFKSIKEAENYRFHNKKIFSLTDIHQLIDQEYPVNKNGQVVLYQKLLQIANNK